MASGDAAAAEDLATRCSNHGRWGAGPPCALALVTRARLLDACALPRRGRVVACGLAPEAGAAAGIETSIHAPRPAPEGVAGRGVLLDLAHAEGVTRLGADEAISPERLDACAESLGVTVEAGDLLLLRTGALADARARGDWEGYRRGPSPGLALGCASWLHRRDVALAACDGRSVAAAGAGARAELPLEQVALRHTGVLLGIHFDLEVLSRACAEDGNYSFLWVAPPLRHPGPNGAQPVALK